MAIRCRKCSREFDITLFEFGKTVRCDCGQEVLPEHRETSGPLDALRLLDREISEKIRELADRIVFLIMHTDMPMRDIGREKETLREMITEILPERSHLYDLVYEARFRRLESQFRKPE